MASSIKSCNLHAGFFKTVISFPLVPMLKWMRSERLKAETCQNPTFLCREVDMQQEKATLYYRDMLFKADCSY